jgi:heme/copper-type cytochrome/quinol oxidase subunit 3
LLSSITFGFAMLEMQRVPRQTRAGLAGAVTVGCAFIGLEMYEFA